MNGFHATMLPNPSHLEAVNPVVMGKARAKHMASNSGDYNLGSENGLTGDDVLCVLVHGDAAFSGQGINQESLLLSYLPHYNVGGTLHLVVNNQIGFTTPSERGKSSRYSSDLAKFVNCPVFHVNGDDPEAVMIATKIALEYQRKFRKEVFVELHCFRRWGHNELDDPTFTNPLLYSKVHARGSVPDAYTEKLTNAQIMDSTQVSKILVDHTAVLNDNFKQIETYKPERSNLKADWQSMTQPGESITQWDTGTKTRVRTTKHFEIH